VYAKDLKFSPIQPDQNGLFASGAGVEPLHPDILLAKLRPGQGIELAAHCCKGIGADHAKYSPVATASYRLLPSIQITSPIIGDDASKFARCFPRGVIRLDTIDDAKAASEPGFHGHAGKVYAVVENAMNDTVSRECLRHPEFKGKVKLGRVQDHFIFRIESTGQFESNDLFMQSVRILRAKCERAKKILNMSS